MNILSILLLFALVVQIVLSKANRFHGYLFMLFSSLLLIPKGIFVISSSLKYYYLAVSFFFCSQEIQKAQEWRSLSNRLSFGDICYYLYL